MKINMILATLLFAFSGSCAQAQAGQEPSLQFEGFTSSEQFSVKGCGGMEPCQVRIIKQNGKYDLIVGGQNIWGALINPSLNLENLSLTIDSVESHSEGSFSLLALKDANSRTVATIRYDDYAEYVPSFTLLITMDGQSFELDLKPTLRLGNSQ